MIGVTAFAREIKRSEGTVRDLERKKIIKAQRDSANRRQFDRRQIAIALAYYARQVSKA
jgi:hypothetical protein